MSKLTLLACLLAACVAVHSVPALADEGHDHHDMAESELGTVHFPVSCSAEAQKTFEKGVALLHSFWYEEAEKRFYRGREAGSEVRDGALGSGHELVASALGLAERGDDCARGGGIEEGGEAEGKDGTGARLYCGGAGFLHAQGVR